MNKVYLVTTQRGDWDDYSWSVFSICRSLEIAEKEKLKVEEKIQNIKTQYYLEFNSDYDKDVELLNDDGLITDNEVRYDDLMHSIYNYQNLHSELNIHTIQIEERELL